MANETKTHGKNLKLYQAWSSQICQVSKPLPTTLHRFESNRLSYSDPPIGPLVESEEALYVSYCFVGWIKVFSSLKKKFDKIVLNRLEVLYIQNFTNKMEWHLVQIEAHLKYRTLGIKLLVYCTISILDLISCNPSTSYMVVIY